MPPNLPPALVQLERLVQPGLGPQLERPPRVHLANRAQVLQGLLEILVFLVTSLRSEQVSTLHGFSKRAF